MGLQDGGSKFEGASEVVEYIPNQRITTRSSKGIDNRISWSFEKTNNGSGTRFTADVDYSIPVPLLGKLAETFIVKQNERETELVCSNLKIRMETTKTPETTLVVS